MTPPKVPEELSNLVDPDDWALLTEANKLGHRTTILEYPGVIADFIENRIFSFQALLAFSWQELQILCINSSHVKELLSRGLTPEDLHLFDPPKLIEILHHLDSFFYILNAGIPLDEIARFSGYQLRLILEHPQAITSILKKFETVDDLLTLKWNWVEEMLLRPEETLMLLEHDVKWNELVHLPDWDFGWFLKHVPEILKLLDLGVDFEIIGNIDAPRLRKSKAFENLIDPTDLEDLDFWQMFMILSHKESYQNLISEGVPKEVLFRTDAYNLERVLENPELFLKAWGSDPDVFREMATLKHVKTDLLLAYSQEFLSILQAGVQLKDISPLSDHQLEEVLKHHERYHAMIQLAGQLEIPYTSILDIDIGVMETLMAFPEQVEKLLKSGLGLNDLTRYPLILPEILKHAGRIIALEKKGISPKELFVLSKDQVIYAFSRFPLFEILPDLGLRVADLEPFLLEEFKVVFSHLKPLSILKKGGIRMRELAEIHLPHLVIMLSYPEYVLSLVDKGVPLYRFAHIEEHQLRHLLADPLSNEAQKLIQRLMA